MNKWYENTPSGVAVSTRVRLARNIEGVPFPGCMPAEQMQSVHQKIVQAVLSGSSALAEQMQIINMDQISDTEAYAMVERHIISPLFAKYRENRVLILSKDESISIMLGEEDHIRIQVIGSGLCLKTCYDIADKIDTLIGEQMPYAFDDTLGFLTECPTNLGTGLRASVMLHLPVLENTREIAQISQTVSKIGLTVRGLYGEGSDSSAAMYQISNQITLGITESAALQNLETIAQQIIDKEVQGRKALDPLALEDTVYRALGILQNARRLTSEEMMQYISRIKLGVDHGILQGVTSAKLFDLFIKTQPYTLCVDGRCTAPEQRDVLRAKIIRQALS